MKEISNSDYTMIIRLLPLLIEDIKYKDGVRKYEAARRLGNMLKKWKRNTKEYNNEQKGRILFQARLEFEER